MWTSFFSSWACAVHRVAVNATVASVIKRSFMSSSSKRAIYSVWLDAAPVENRLRDRAGIHVFQLAAQRNATRDPADLDVAGPQHFRDVVRSRLTFVGEV